MASSENDSLTYLQTTGGQWREARGFLRRYAGNPFAQLELVKVLAGLHKNASESWNPNSNSEGSQLPSPEAALAIASTIRYIREQLPEWASLEPITLDSDLGHFEDYPGCDPEVKHYIEETILSGEFDQGGIT